MTLATTGICRGHQRGGQCHAPITWTLSANDERQPIDPAPVEDGPLVVWYDTDDRGRTILRNEVAAQGSLLDQARKYAPGRYNPHHRTCPDAGRFRR